MYDLVHQIRVRDINDRGFREVRIKVRRTNFLR